MDEISPFLRLRGDWRQAAAVSMPASAAEIATLLDRALDLLEKHNQLDTESLIMASDTIAEASSKRPDEVNLLKHRLRLAIRDFESATATEEWGSGEAGMAFESEEALSAALGALLDPDAVEEPEVAAPAAQTGPRVDVRSLRKELTREPGAGKRWLGRIGTAVVVLAILAGLGYLGTHLHDLLIPVSSPTPSQGQIVTGTGVTGSFQSGIASCSGGQPSPDGKACLFSFSVATSGSFAARLTAVAPGLQLSLVSGSGKTYGTGTPAGATSQTVTVASLPAGSYLLQVVAAHTQSDAFTVKILPNG